MISVLTAHPVAVDSPDHLVAHGTAQDNSRNHRFNEKLYAFLPQPRPLRILDIGCAGGGFVKDCIDDGHIAIGLEGSDYSLKNKRAEWTTIPANLFTCDVTHFFHILEDNKPMRFDVVTAWEFLEHIREDDLPLVLHHIRHHMAKGGVFIGSVSMIPYAINGVQLHQTVREKSWWDKVFRISSLGYMTAFPENYFGHDYIRGPHQDCPASFNFILKEIA
jgi:2-polyprenyl-3-methyl-5-hydroxy-6-metoxy-1,4-benzoquinol methylase